MSIDRIGPYFGFTRPPFGTDLAPGALHRSGAHEEAKARIAYLVQTGALGLITGEVGAGKTTAVRAATAALEPSRHTVIYVPNPAIGLHGIYLEIVTRLGGEPRFHKSKLIPQAQELLAREREERNKRVLLILDEAHLLSTSQLEELRLLTNSEMDSVRPFAGILLGQPQLRKRLRLGSFAALDQRIALRYELSGMDGSESAEYLVHHLKLAGREDRLFSDDAMALLHERSRGIPRALNNLATQALVATFATEKAIVDESAAQAAVAEVLGE
ncbi:MAG TPA: AAA family ATPase [Solirubrobacterales bacterium]|nr:AAA family ATPase [Solirubrobacterales bacterium]